ncbi:MAG TPA: ABC transporter ATP-binding protein [Verrucomicrobiae bacterium]|nr:ABC transporter ATP-binding protein [Verrucomicrobiae bacterium]
MITDNKLLQIKDLNIAFPHGKEYLPVVRGVDLNVAKGEIVGILGESGSGKTVTATAVLGLTQEDEGRVEAGEILYKGQDIVQLRDRALRKIRGKEVAYIFQDPVGSLNPYRPVGKQVQESLKIHGLDSSHSRVLEVLRRVGLDNAEVIYYMYPGQLSGGQCQRIAIAAAIACNPELLIADEPISAIDASLQKKILGLLQDINRNLGMSIIIITHDFAVVRFLCHRVVVMYGGLVMESGTVAEVLHNPLHPYTRELLRCEQSLNEADANLYTLQGRTPNALEFRDECPFYPRCKEKQAACLKGIPPEIYVGGRSFRCNCISPEMKDQAR